MRARFVMERPGAIFFVMFEMFEMFEMIEKIIVN